MVSLSAGAFDQRVTLLLPTSIVDELGQPVETFVEFGTVWAQVSPLRGKDLIAAQANNSTATVRFRLRYDDRITGRWRLRWRGLDYDVDGEPIDVDGKRETLEVMASAPGRT